MTNDATSTTIVPNIPNKAEPFYPQKIESWLALLAFVLGYIFIRWVFFSWQGWGVSLFTALYAGFVIVYMRLKGRAMTKESWFWFSMLILTGLSYAIFDAHGLQPWREFFLFGSAIYWVLCASGMSLLGGTSDWLPLDFLQGLVVIPFRNFGLQYKSLAMLRTKQSSENKQLWWSVALGLLLALLFTAVVLPLLLEADSGGFMAILEQAKWMQFNSFESFVYLLLTIPTAAYLYGLVAGSAHGRANPAYQLDKVDKWVSSLRILPTATVLTLLGAINLLYIVFIGSQIPYFFSAFWGSRPEGWQVYSAYARNGFFELCGIAVINLSVLAGANLGVKHAERKHMVLKTLNILLASLTLVLIATAFSKMALYISVYGLSVKRVLPCVLMIFLAMVCGAVVVLQKKQFSIMRLSAFVGAILLCVLSLSNIDGVVANYNARRYMSGTLTDFDVTILFRAGPAGVDAALRVYNWTKDEELRDELNHYLYNQLDRTNASAGKVRDTLQNRAVRKSLAKHAFSKGIPGFDYP